MLNVLIADDNIDYARNLMYLINSTSANVRVFDITITGQETLEILSKPNNIDIILLDLNMPFLNGLEIINQLSVKYSQKYDNSFIIISGETTLLEQMNLLESYMVYKVLSKGMDLNFIVNSINELILTKSFNGKIRNRISTELCSIGYLLAHNGTQYLIDIIEMAYFRGEYVTNNLSKYAYPIIANRYLQSVNNIKTSIIRATEAMYFNCYEETLLNYFNLNTISKPNIKTIVGTILLKISSN